MRFLTAGETGLAVEFGNSIDETVNAQVTRLNNWLNGEISTGDDGGYEVGVLASAIRLRQVRVASPTDAIRT